MPTDNERKAYRRGRAAIKVLAGGPSAPDRNFNWWKDYSHACVAVRTEAMRDANANAPVGKAYNAAHKRIMEREQLDKFDDNTRKDCVALIDNLRHPVDPRRKLGILAWRSGLDPDTRAKLNHPSVVLRRWRAATEPEEDKKATAVIADAAPVQKRIAEQTESDDVHAALTEILRAHRVLSRADAWSDLSKRKQRQASKALRDLLAAYDALHSLSMARYWPRRPRRPGPTSASAIPALPPGDAAGSA